MFKSISNLCQPSIILSLDLSNNHPVTKIPEEVRHTDAHFDLNTATTEPQIGWLKVDDVLRQYDGQLFTATRHEEWRDCIEHVATEAQCVIVLRKPEVESLVGNLLAGLGLAVLVLFHDCEDLLGVQLAFKLCDHNHILRVGWVILDFWEISEANLMFGVLHDDRLA